MPTLPWTKPNPAAPDAVAFVMASRFEVLSFKDVPGFFLKSLSAWKQVRKAPGCFGASLEAQLFKGVFFTLSAWEDKKALYTYAKTDPHKSVVAGLRSVENKSTFVFWEVPAGQLPIDWKDAKRRIDAKAAEDAAGAGAS